MDQFVFELHWPFIKVTKKSLWLNHCLSQIPCPQDYLFPVNLEQWNRIISCNSTGAQFCFKQYRILACSVAYYMLFIIIRYYPSGLCPRFILMQKALASYVDVYQNTNEDIWILNTNKRRSWQTTIQWQQAKRYNDIWHSGIYERDGVFLWSYVINHFAYCEHYKRAQYYCSCIYPMMCMCWKIQWSFGILYLQVSKQMCTLCVSLLLSNPGKVKHTLFPFKGNHITLHCLPSIQVTNLLIWVYYLQRLPIKTPVKLTLKGTEKPCHTKAWIIELMQGLDLQLSCVQHETKYYKIISALTVQEKFNKQLLNI